VTRALAKSSAEGCACRHLLGSFLTHPAVLILRISLRPERLIKKELVVHCRSVLSRHLMTQLWRWESWSERMFRNTISLLIFFGICFVVGASGSAFTASSVKTWYPGLLKPTGTPPSWVFGPVWSILYLLMAVAAWLVWRQRIHERVWLALALFIVQLILNGLWSFVFFGLRRSGAALVEIMFLLGAIAVTAMRFAEFSRLAFWLMTPYGAWVLYASYLNFGIWRLNKGTT
jgi:translocator protein